MKKGLLFTGLIVALTMICCYALVASNVTKQTAATTNSFVATNAPVVEKPQDTAVATTTQIISEPGTEASISAPNAKLEKELLTTKPHMGTLDGDLDCTGATPITCGDSFIGEATGTVNACSTYSCVAWNESGNEVVYEFSLPAGDWIVSVALANMTADFDVFFLDGCEEANCLYYGDSGFNTDCLTGPATYYIVVDGYNGAAGTYDLSVSCADCGGGPPANDECATAELVAVPSSTAGTTIGANSSCGYSGMDVFYYFTLAECRLITVSLCQTDPLYDTYLYLYEDPNCCGTALYTDDDYCAYYGPSQITNKALNAGTYYVQVDGWGSNSGDFILDIIDNGPCSAPPVNDNCADAIAIQCGVVDLYVDLVGATMDCATNGYPEVWYTFELDPGTAAFWDVAVSYCGTDPGLGTIGANIQNDCLCDDYFGYSGASATYCPLITWLPEELYFYSVPAGTWYLPVYTDISTFAILDLTCTPVAECIPDFQVTLDCAVGYAHDWSTIGAGNDCNFETSEDIIYEFTVVEARNYTFSLCATDTSFDWDSRLYLTDACCAGLQLGYDDDACGYPPGMSAITCVALTAGTYYLHVEGYSGSVGDYHLDVECCPEYPVPVNDDCADAIPIACGDLVVGTTLGATPEVDCAALAGYNVVWYEFTLTGECTDVTVAYCGTDPVLTSVLIVMTDDCFCSNFFYYTGSDWNICGEVNPTSNPTIYYAGMAAGTYLFPCWVEVDGVAGSDFQFLFTCDDCGPQNCQPCEEAISMGNGMSYQDLGAETCTWNGLDQTCVVGCAPYELACAGAQYTASFKKFYTFTLLCETTIDVYCDPIDGVMDPQLMIFTECPTIGGSEDCASCVASSDTGSSPWDGMPEAIIATMGPGTFYLSVDCYGGGRCGTYDLTVSSSDCPLPVELSSFEAIAGNNEVALTWTTASELNNDYFEIQRSTSDDWTTVGTVEGTNEATGSSYDYTDRAVVNGVTYSYRLVSHDINGAVNEYEMTAEATPTAPLPTEYALDQNFPNPFNPTTTINYALKDAGFVTLRVYNLLGQEVANLVSQRMEVGNYSVNFDANTLPSGIYIYRLEVNDFSAQQKMVLLK